MGEFIYGPIKGTSVEDGWNTRANKTSDEQMLDSAKADSSIDITFTIRFWWLARLSSAEDGGGGGLEREEPKPALRFLFAAVPFSCHPLLLHLPLHLLKKIRHLHLFVVPEPMTLHQRHTSPPDPPPPPHLSS